MAKLTLLDMTQDILSSLNSDEVNSISDTTEAMQVARLIRSKYYDLIVRANLPEQQTLIKLTASTDPDKPTLMYVPDGVIRIDYLKYFDADTSFGSVTPGYKYLTPLTISDFLDLVNSFNPSEAEVGTMVFTEGGNDFTFYYKDNSQPKYYTVIENNYIVFDTYNSDLDTTLQNTKTMAYGLMVTPFTFTDNFIPDLEDDKFPLLLNEAKALAFYELKQQPHPKADLEIKRQWSALQNDKRVLDKPTAFEALADFGRRRTVWGSNRWMRGR